jgi:hypothetical protein
VGAGLGDFPVLSGPVGQFLSKDVVLLGAALDTAGEALEATEGGRPAAPVSVR